MLTHETCKIFDTLFVTISQAAGAAYKNLTSIAVIIFCVLLAFYILNVGWQQIKKQGSDPMFQKSLKPVLIRALIALALLSSGLYFPKFISKITFEPTTTITLYYAEMFPKPENEEATVNYQPIQIRNPESGIFNPELRDTFLTLLQRCISSFKVYIEFGVRIIDAAFSLHALLGIGNLIKHFMILIIGLFLTYNFVRLFIKYLFCFIDVVLAMAMFAFFFPFSVIFFIFKDAEDAPGWMKNLGGSLGASQIKKLLNAIVSVASAILTYTVIIFIIRGFLTYNHTTEADLGLAMVDNLFTFDLDHSSIMEITFAGSIVLVYIIRYLADQIPQVTEKILSAFGVKQENSLSKEMGENVLTLTDTMFKNAKQGAKMVLNPEAAIEANNKKESGDSKDKKEEK